jgi:hypothetical protein
MAVDRDGVSFSLLRFTLCEWGFCCHGMEDWVSPDTGLLTWNQPPPFCLYTGSELSQNVHQGVPRLIIIIIVTRIALEHGLSYRPSKFLTRIQTYIN